MNHAIRTSQLNLWKIGLNPGRSFAHIRNNGQIFHVTSIRRIVERKNQSPLLLKTNLPENVGFDILIENMNRKAGFVHAEIISTGFKPEDAKQEKTFKKLENKKVLIQVR